MVNTRSRRLDDVYMRWFEVFMAFRCGLRGGCHRPTGVTAAIAAIISGIAAVWVALVVARPGTR